MKTNRCMPQKSPAPRARTGLTAGEMCGCDPVPGSGYACTDWNGNFKQMAWSVEDAVQWTNNNCPIEWDGDR